MIERKGFLIALGELCLQLGLGFLLGYLTWGI